MNTQLAFALVRQHAVRLPEQHQTYPCAPV